MHHLGFVTFLLFIASYSFSFDPEVTIRDVGMYRVSTASPKLHLGDPHENAKEYIRIINESAEEKVDVLLFPELGITGYNMQDYFYHDVLLERAKVALQEVIARMPEDIIVVVGMPLKGPNQRLYNTAVVLHNNKIVGVVPKFYRPNYLLFDEQRYFETGNEVEYTFEDSRLGTIHLSHYQIFQLRDLKIGVEICEDLWGPETPSTELALNGANLIVNLSASPELAGRRDYRRGLIKGATERLIAAMAYGSAGPWESTSSVVFGGHLLIYENGHSLAEDSEISFLGKRITADIDIQQVDHDRLINTTFRDTRSDPKYPIKFVGLKDRQSSALLSSLLRTVDPKPFHSGNLESRATEIIEIAATGLARRLLDTGSKNMILGLSGGRDSTLALLFMAKARQILERTIEGDPTVSAKFGGQAPGIFAVTMPGFATSAETRTAADELAGAFDFKLYEHPIGESATTVLQELGHDGASEDISYENVQARLRTLFLFQLGNSHNGLVVGTGDLSELCLGWCTYNADQMSHYNVVSSIPKTLVEDLMRVYALHFAENDAQRKVLLSILQQEISPELKGAQSTEDIIGKYEIHDFIIFHFLRYNSPLTKIRLLASIAFRNKYSDKDLDFAFENFSKRFPKNQFKRNGAPDGVQVGIVSTSPRVFLRLPTEACSALFDWKPKK